MYAASVISSLLLTLSVCCSYCTSPRVSTLVGEVISTHPVQVLFRCCASPRG
jgi:hypothetical protein